MPKSTPHNCWAIYLTYSSAQTEWDNVLFRRDDVLAVLHPQAGAESVMRAMWTVAQVRYPHSLAGLHEWLRFPDFKRQCSTGVETILWDQVRPHVEARLVYREELAERADPKRGTVLTVGDFLESPERQAIRERRDEFFREGREVPGGNGGGTASGAV